MWNESAKPAISVDFLGNVEATRYFRVGNASSNAIVSAPSSILRGVNNYGLPENDALPDYGDELNGFSGCTLEQYIVEGNGLVVDVQAKYASGGITIFPAPELNGAWQGSFQTEVFQLPFAIIKRSFVPGNPSPDAPPGSPIPRVQVNDWSFEEQPVFQTIVRHSRKAIIPVNLANAIETIAEQNNKLHRIGSRWYRFEAGDYRRYDNARYEFTYSFIYDSGMRNTYTARAAPPPTDPGGGPSPVAPQYAMPPNTASHPVPTVYPGRVWTRPPFCNVFALRGTGDTGSQYVDPDFVVFCNFDVSANNGLGWLDLPGIFQ